ncbi:hypothetical protein [Paenibacillus hexagrammi]|nr:hypothetical protein [Paenibacillus sp. YPD9-1]
MGVAGISYAAAQDRPAMTQPDGTLLGMATCSISCKRKRKS